jgi:signal transduction histidine kinase
MTSQERSRSLNNIVMQDEKQLKILMLEDSKDDVFLIERVLRKDNLSFVKECVDTREEFHEAIRKFQPDVVLSDHGLPGFNSREALKICLKERSSTPFILVTGTVSEDYAIACLRDGADDYILKSNLSRLPAAIRGAMKKRKLEKLKREARHALRKQNEELLKANRELDSFVYSVSHNLRGPLASLMGLLNIARDEDKDQRLVQVHDMMNCSMAKLEDTLKEILEYSRNARGELQLGKIDWLRTIEASLSKLEYLDKGNHIEKLIRLQTDVPFCSDGGRLGIIFVNLLSNAILYRDKTRDSVVNIDVLTTEKTATITIKDNGVGIKDDVKPYIFNMFYRGTELSQGAGLGLYIAKETVSKLMATIEIESTHGEGTKVTVTVPNMG